MIDQQMKRKLLAVDAAYNIVRHVTPVSASMLLEKVDLALAGPSLTPPAVATSLPCSSSASSPAPPSVQYEPFMDEIMNGMGGSSSQASAFSQAPHLSQAFAPARATSSSSSSPPAASGSPLGFEVLASRIATRIDEALESGFAKSAAMLSAWAAGGLRDLGDAGGSGSPPSASAVVRFSLEPPEIVFFTVDSMGGRASGS